MRILLPSLLVIFAIGLFSVPSAFADAIVTNAPGSSVPGCEETADGCFIPSTVTIDVGGTVTWENNDTAAHTATSGSATNGPDGVWDSSLIMAGSSFSHTFDTAGTYDYMCMVHPWMAGTVIVGDGTPTQTEVPDTTPPTISFLTYDLINSYPSPGVALPSTNTITTPSTNSTGMLTFGIKLTDDTTEFGILGPDAANILTLLTCDATNSQGGMENYLDSAPPSQSYYVLYVETPVKYYHHAPFPVGTTTVTCTATDEAGNPASASFTVTVTQESASDTTPPVIVTAEEANSSADNSTSTAPPPEPELYDEATPTITVTTDKASYIVGETVQISGTFENSDTNDIIIKITAANGNVVAVTQASVSDDSFSWVINTSVYNVGTYTITTNPIGYETTFEVIENTVTVTNAPGSSTPGCEPNCFLPSTAYISFVGDMGGTVIWTNSDTAAHTATSGSATNGPDGVWDSSLIQAGGSFSYTFDEQGIYDYFCMVHPWMAGTVIAGDPAEIEAAAAAAEAEAEAAAAEAAAAEAAWMEANPGVVLNAAGSSVPGCEETNSCFIPSTITVSAGQGITWYNSDTAAHTSTAGSGTEGPSGVFDSSLIMAGSSFSHTFDAPGTYPYFCMVHPWMAGTVIVQGAGCGPGTVLVDGVCEIAPEPEPEPVETEAEVVSQSDEITAGSEIQIETEIANQQDGQQTFAYIVQIKDEIGATISISMITGAVGQGQTITQTISWTPSESGVYVAEVYLWSDLNQPLILSSVETQYITVN